MGYSPQKIKNIITQKALSIDFSAVGFANAKPINNQLNHYISWLSEHHHGEMKYLENYIDKRKDPRLLLEGAKTVIIFMQNYYWPDEYDLSLLLSGDYGIISRYARGMDYHKIIKNKLFKIAGTFDEMGYTSKCLVDSGPVLEKQWAQIAGIGWQGKNSLIISKSHGSWIFLGTLITDAEIPPDKPSKNHCGNCIKCMDACPTGAIIQPGVIDARKCIAYWTIEARSEINIPKSISCRALPWVYGCDICQDVCPWNTKFQNKTTEDQFKQINSLININEFNEISTNEFNNIFKGTAVKRLKLDGLKRNIKNIFLKNR